MAEFLGLVLFKPKRAIDSFENYVTIEEQHTDELNITQHPVEQGAPITDHAYKNPAQLTIRAGWSNSSLQAIAGAGLSLLGGDIQGLLSPSYAEEMYGRLLQLQAEREPFDIFTGKRRYKNMLMRSLSTTTDEKTENVLVVTASFQEVILVETQATTLPPAANQANAAKTAGVENAGSKQLAPAGAANQSAISAIAGG